MSDKPEPKRDASPASKGNRTGSPVKTGSAKKSAKGGSKSPKRTPSPGKKGKSAKEEPKVEEMQQREELEELPENVVPIFFASKTQELFLCVSGEHVTPENPFKLIPKGDIIQDLKTRAAISDFHPVKQTALEYSGTEMLVVLDIDFKFGQNFYIALTEESKEILLNPPKEEGKGEGGGGDEEEEEEEEIVYKYIPPVSKEWVSQGSEMEIEEENITETRPRIKFTVSRVRHEFGPPVTFSDRNADDVKDGFIECTPFEDKNFTVKKMELDKAVQAIPELDENGSQTLWKYPKNACTQYVSRTLDDGSIKKIVKSSDFGEFVVKVTPRFELALQQNEIMDVFFDDWVALGDEDDTFGNKSDSALREYQSFTDLQFSKDKTITSIDWHPTMKGVVAVSCTNKFTFDERVDLSTKILMSPSLVLIWSFNDPIHPQILLEAPDDIMCFKFNPTDPNIIAGGCTNGQVVLWSIAKWADRLKTQKAAKTKKNAMAGLPGYEEENSTEVPIVRYCAVSSIENSHKSAITDIQWVPDHMEVNRVGAVLENKSSNCCQLVTASPDGSVCFWDTRPPKGYVAKDTEQSNNPFQIPTTFKYLDLTWKPLLKVPAVRIDGSSGEYSATIVSISESQGSRNPGKPEMGASAGPGGPGGLTGLRAGSAKDKKPLENVSTKFFLGTEDGELVYADWKLEKDSDSGKLVAPRPYSVKLMHDGEIKTLQRSPFFSDILLVVGGWTFSVWKEGAEGVQDAPLLMSSASTKTLTCGRWSPSRPGVFFIGKSDGNLDVWDLLDRTHQPSMTQNVSSSRLTQIIPWVISSKQQFLAISDNVGTLHILEMPWNLRHASSNESASILSYLDREVKRLEFVEKRRDFRVQDKRRLEAEEAKRKAAKPSDADDAEAEAKMRMEFLNYEEMEKKYLEGLGLYEEPDEDLPET